MLNSKKERCYIPTFNESGDPLRILNRFLYDCNLGVSDQSCVDTAINLIASAYDIHNVDGMLVRYDNEGITRG